MTRVVRFQRIRSAGIAPHPERARMPRAGVTHLGFGRVENHVEGCRAPTRCSRDPSIFTSPLARAARCERCFICPTMRAPRSCRWSCSARSAKASRGVLVDSRWSKRAPGCRAPPPGGSAASTRRAPRTSRCARTDRSSVLDVAGESDEHGARPGRRSRRRAARRFRAKPWQTVVVREDGFIPLGAGVSIVQEPGGDIAIRNRAGRDLIGVC